MNQVIVVCPQCDLALSCNVHAEKHEYVGWNCECGAQIKVEYNPIGGVRTTAYSAYLEAKASVRRNAKPDTPGNASGGSGTQE